MGNEAAQDRTPGRFATRDVALVGVVSAVPQRVVLNDQFEAQFGADAVSSVCKMTGVKARHWVAEGQTTADLCAAAGDRLLDQLGWSRDSIDAVVFVSQTPDHPLPATACLLQARLGLAPTTAAFDVNLGCSGYVYGLWLAACLTAGGCRRVLLLAGDTISRIVDETDRGTAMLFGDVGTASVLEVRPGAAPMHFVLGTDGRGGPNLQVARGCRTPDASGFLHMNGPEIFNFTLEQVAPLVERTLEFAERNSSDIDYFVMHQANAFMLKHIGKKLKINSDRLPINIDRYGNTSSGSVPLVLTTDLAAPLSDKAQKLALVGFGVGYSWGCAVLECGPLACVETISA